MSLPTSIDPYDVLGIDKDATPNQIKSAYRKAALKHHPDKSTHDQAHQKFQEIAFAYAILSDPKRRKRYDTTGNTAESLVDDDDFDWVDYFREQTNAMVDGEMIEKIKKEYQGSEEERQDVLRVYTESQGDMDAVYEETICSNVLDDDSRFRGYIDEAIKTKEVQGFKKYVKESKAKRKRREQTARGEAAEASQLVEELNLKGQDSLRALIQKRQQDRSTSFMDQLEAKYGGSKKRRTEEPPEELFQKNAKKAK